MSLVGAMVMDAFTTQQNLERGFAQGNRFNDQEGRTFVYVRAAVALAANDLVQMTPAHHASPVSTAGALRGLKCGVVLVAFNQGEYGWAQIDGPSSVNVLPSCAAGVRLNTTTTAGKLDDDGTAGSRQVQGVYLTAANGGAIAARACILTNPFIDVTL